MNRKYHLALVDSTKHEREWDVVRWGGRCWLNHLEVEIQVIATTPLTNNVERDFMKLAVLADKTIFSGEKEGASSVLKDTILTAGKDHVSVCHHCGGDVRKGSLHRYAVAVWDGFYSTRVCYACCAAFMIAEYDDWQLYSKRLDCHRRRT
jgi:hypothetical protein